MLKHDVLYSETFQLQDNQHPLMWHVRIRVVSVELLDTVHHHAYSKRFLEVLLNVMHMYVYAFAEHDYALT